MTYPSQSTEADEDRPFYTKTGFLLAAAFLAGVALLGLILLLTGGGDEPQAAPTTPAQNATDAAPATSPPPDEQFTTATAAPQPAATTVCPDLSGTDGDLALTQAPDVQWSSVGEVAAAISEDNGPANREGVKSCFAQTPTGALLAAHNFLADLRTGSLDAVEVVETRMDQAAPGYSTLLAQAAEPPKGANPPVSVVGYRFLESTANGHTIALVQRLPGSSDALFAQDQVTLEWSGSDWLISSAADPQQLDGLPPGFIEWGPEVSSPE